MSPHRARTPSIRRRPAAALAVSCSAILLVSAVSLAFVQDPKKPAEKIRDARATLEKWVETRQLISEEKSEWAVARQSLLDRIDLVQSQVDRLKNEIAEDEAGLTEVDEQKVELTDEQEKLKEASAGLAALIDQLEERTVKLIARLPEPIVEKVRPLTQRIPKDPAATKESLSARFANVAGILNEVNKFHGQVSAHTEVRELADGTEAQVTAMYFGLGQAFYSGGEGGAAGFGTVNPDGGWTWTPASDAADDIHRAIKILNNEEKPGFVRLPIRVR